MPPRRRVVRRSHVATGGFPAGERMDAIACNDDGGCSSGGSATYGRGDSPCRNGGGNGRVADSWVLGHFDRAVAHASATAGWRVDELVPVGAHSSTSDNGAGCSPFMVVVSFALGSLG